MSPGQRHDRGNPPPAFDPVSASRDIVSRCRALGFAAAGIAPVQPSRWAPQVIAWLEAGRHGTMEYLAADMHLRLSPGDMLHGARAFIMVADQYARRGEEDPAPIGARGRIAKYARGRDYHQAMKKRLHALSDRLRIDHPGAEFRSFVDTVPVLERELAELAGIGWQAKNTILIHPRLGSYLLLGGVATTLPLVSPPEQERYDDHCGTCTRCIDACPTRAISPYTVDATRCISYLTIERRREIPVEFHRAIGDWLYGCDICQDVCPHNSPRAVGAGDSRLNPAYEPRHDSFDLLEVLGWGRAEREDTLKSSAMKRASLAMMKRNALIVAGNSLRKRPDAALLARVRELALDENEPELVRRTAADILADTASG